MNNVIVKTIADVKNDIGVYYHIPDFNYVADPHLSGYDNFMVVWHKVISAHASFEEKVSFFHALINGEYLRNNYVLTIKEKFNFQYATWFGEDERKAIFTDLESAKKEMLTSLQYAFSSFMENIKYALIYKAIQNKGFVKTLAIKTAIGKKLNFLTENQNAFEGKELTDFLKVRKTLEYNNEKDEVIVPVNWDLICKSSKLDFTYIKDHKIKKVGGYLLKANFDQQTKSMSMVLELENNDTYNFPRFFFDKEKGEYSFSSKNIFFNNENAVARLKEMIAESEMLTKSMKDELECLQEVK